MFLTNETLRRTGSKLRSVILIGSLLYVSPAIYGQTDPGVRGGSAAAGGAISGLTVKEGKFFQAGSDGSQNNLSFRIPRRYSAQD